MTPLEWRKFTNSRSARATNGYDILEVYLARDVAWAEWKYKALSWRLRMSKP
jgi:hypothetical protein